MTKQQPNDISKNNLLANLNPEQALAVTCTNNAALILAGAGSGKTRVLTVRIAWLIHEHSVNMDEILAVTFTNKAAKEMINRVSDLLHVDARKMWIGTFHAISLKLLSKHHVAAGLPSYFQIIDANEQLSVIKKVIKNANLEEEKYPIREIRKFINHHKERGMRAKDVVGDTLRSKQWVDIYHLYEQMCNKNNFIDFTELLLRSYELLSKHTDILEEYQKQFKHILIDEFQDTNDLQYQWLKLIKSKKTNIFAVGDDDQSIYEFRGANPENMQKLCKEFDIKEPVRLEQNYRSTSTILNAANAVINHNKSRIGKTLWTENEIGNKIKFYEGYTEDDEAYFVADEISNIIRRKQANLAEIAILYRSNAQSRVFEQLFHSKGIPYKMHGSLSFFDRQEIKNLIAYLKLLANPNDDEAFLRVINFPIRSIGAKTIELIQAAATEHNTSLFEACKYVDSKAQAKISKFTDLIKSMIIDTMNFTLADLINDVISKSGLLSHYQQEKNGHDRLENMNELINSIDMYQNQDHNELNLPKFLSHIAIDSSDAHGEHKGSTVQLMTVHAAKGLEFNTVFLAGMEDGLFPHENCLSSNEDIEEERRLMYVAITRAKSQLYILRACSRLMWGKRHNSDLSRFVSEIPYELLDNMSGINLDSAMSNEQSYHKTAINPESRISSVKVNDGLNIKIGDKLSHNKFGVGRVVYLHTSGSKQTADIIFKTSSGEEYIKSLDLNIAKLNKVE